MDAILFVFAGEKKKSFSNAAWSAVWSVASAHQLPELTNAGLTCAGCLNELMGAIKGVVCLDKSFPRAIR